MKTIFNMNDCINIFLDTPEPPAASPVDGQQLGAMIQGMEAVGAVPIDWPLTDGMTFFFADDKKAVAVEVGNERLQNYNSYLDPNKGKPFYITAATHYAPLQKQGSTAAV